MTQEPGKGLRTQARPPPALSRDQWSWRGALGGAAIGCGVGVLATFLGEVRATPLLLLALVVGAALLGSWRPTRGALWLASGTLAALCALCLLTPLLRGPLAALTESAPPQRADAIVVLGAGVQCGTGVLEASSLARTIRGLELWRQGYAPRLTVSEQSGLIGPADCPKMSDLERTQIQALVPQGGPEVLTLRRVTTTRDEAARVRELARYGGWRRVILVTSPWHSRRTAALFRAGLTPQGVQVISVNAPEVRFDTTLSQPYDRLFALRVVLYEGLSRLKAALGGTPER